MDTGELLDSPRVRRALAREREARARAVDRAENGTRARVYAIVLASARFGCTSTSIAQLLEITPQAVRIHLAALAREGAICRPYAGRGARVFASQ